MQYGRVKIIIETILGEELEGNFREQGPSMNIAILKNISVLRKTTVARLDCKLHWKLNTSLLVSLLSSK